MKPDWAIFSLMATAMGYPMEYHNTEEIWDEMRALCPLYAGVSYDKMADLKSVQWPCPTEDHPGTSTLFEGNVFTTPSGKGQLIASSGGRRWSSPVRSTRWCSPPCAR